MQTDVKKKRKSRAKVGRIAIHGNKLVFSFKEPMASPKEAADYVAKHKAVRSIEKAKGYVKRVDVDEVDEKTVEVRFA